MPQSINNPILFNPRGNLHIPPSARRPDHALIANVLGTFDQDRFSTTSSDWDEFADHFNLYDRSDRKYSTVLQTIVDAYFGEDSSWLTDSIPDQAAVWSQMKEAVNNRETDERGYTQSLLWLADQLIALDEQIAVIPSLVNNGVDGGTVYCLKFEPSECDENTPIDFIYTGDSSNPHFYSQMALESAKQGNIVYVIGHGSDYLSGGYTADTTSGERTRFYGDYGIHNAANAEAALFESLIASEEINQSQATRIRFFNHSGGSIRAHLANASGGLTSLDSIIDNIQFIDIAPAWALSRRPLFGTFNNYQLALLAKELNFDAPIFRSSSLLSLRRVSGDNREVAFRTINRFWASNNYLDADHFWNERLLSNAEGPYANALGEYQITEPLTLVYSIRERNVGILEGIQNALNHYTADAPLKVVFVDLDPDNPNERFEENLLEELSALQEANPNNLAIEYANLNSELAGGHMLTSSELSIRCILNLGL